MENKETQPVSQIDVVDTVRQHPPGKASFAPGFYGNILETEGQDCSWLWQGYLAQGMTTLLTSQSKSGKTTLLSILLSRMREGGELAGLKVKRGKAVVLSEESVQLWRPRQLALDLSHVYFFCRPFLTRPTPDTWLEFIDHVAELQPREGFQLFVIDTLASFLPTSSENNALGVINALAPLRKLTDLGMALLYQHHPRKGFALAGQAARGSGAFGAWVDIIMEMGYCADPGDGDRRRKILAFGRNQATHGQCVIELNAAGTDYLLRGDIQEDDFIVNWNTLLLVLEEASGKLSCDKILGDWPPDFPRPSDMTLRRWLRRALELGLVSRDGTGLKASPYRYWLPHKEAIWKQDPMYQINQMMEESRKVVDAVLAGKKTA